MMASPTRFSLFKKGNRYHILYYVHGKRRWKATGATTKPEALKALSHFQGLLNKTPKPVSLREFVGRFCSFADGNYSRKTTEIYRLALPRLNRLVGNRLLVEVTAEHFDKYKTERLKRVRPASVNIELRSIRAAFNTAKRWKLIEANPFADSSLASVPESTPQFISPQEFEALLSCIRERWLREIVLFGVLTGMRRGEILALRWQSVDFSQKLLHIETGPSFKTKQGKRRTIPLNDTALYLLNSRQGKSTSEYVFTLNDAPIRGDWATHLFKRYVRKAKLDDRVHFHSLRHTFASWLVQGGATLYQVQQLLGHSAPQVTQVYSHLQPEHLHETVNKISVVVN